MMDYQTAVRGAFFDIAGVAETPDGGRPGPLSR